MIKYYLTSVGDKPRIHEIENFETGCWIELVNPTDDEINEIREFTAMPEDFLKAALDEEESARVEFDDGATMYLVDSPMLVDTEEGNMYTTMPVAIVYNERCIVSVSLNANPVLQGIRLNRTPVSTRKPVGFILNFMLENAKRFSYSLKQIDKKSLRLQAELHKSMRNQELIELLVLQDSLVYFSTALSGNASVYGRLSRIEGVQSSEEYRDLADDVLIESRQATETCGIYRDILKTTMDAFSSVISNNVNNVVKRLSIITILVSIPTLIAGLFGMNVDIPFGWGESGDASAVAFWIILGVAVVLTALCSILLVRMTDKVRIRTPKQIKKKRR